MNLVAIQRVCSNGTGSGEGHNRDSSHGMEKVSS